MKIGIMTWFFGANYGAKLHSFALLNALNDMGHDACFIGYYPASYKKLNVKMNLNCPHYKRKPVHMIKCLSRAKKFDDFNSLFPTTRIVKTGEEIDTLDLDCVIFGSDAIFNLNHPFSNEIYYGVGVKHTKKITYAPCCENFDAETKLSDDIKESLRSFGGLTARDETTAQLLRSNINKNVRIVLDPTFLYDFNSITPKIKKLEEINFLLLYTFSDWSCYKEQILSYSKQHRLNVVSVGRYYPWADYNYESASVYEWLACFQNCHAVFTDSFHGLCFSIKNRKNFAVVAREDKKIKIKICYICLELKSIFMLETRH